MDIHRILQRVPEFAHRDDLTITELTGGITNKNYKITVDGESYVLRMGGNETKYLGIDRRVEFECSGLAAQIGIAPEPTAFLEPEGYIVARFISGKGIPAEEIGTEENIKRVLESMKAYHAIGKFPGSFSPFRVAEGYAETAHNFKVKLPDKMDWYLERSREIEKAMYGREPLQLRPCHRAAYADYYERALYNHILASIHPTVPGYVYFTPIRPAHYRVYSQPEKGFWCCVGTGMENPGRYGEFIYAQATNGLYVNLFVPSEITVTNLGLTLRQETKFPDEPRTRLTLRLPKPATFTLHLRHPGWVATNDFAVRDNGERVKTASSPASYVALNREWRDGDRVEVELPMRTHIYL